MILTKQFDVVIIGAGGAGLRAALELKTASKNVAVVSKVFPTRSHTVSAQGGIAAAIGNVDTDSWQQHMFDTIKGSDYLGDQDGIEFMCKNGPEVVYELEHMGLPFSRLANGKIYQRAFGGQSKIRTLAAADRTGHALLHTLYQKNLQAKTIFFSEWYAIDLVKSINNSIAGVVILNIATGELLFLHAKAIVLATGGAGQIYQATSNALINTGDGIGMVLRAGLPVQDMEMWQFHPTGIYGKGILITEGARGEGGHLLNKNNERFMERYAPNNKELATRDVVARAIAIEILEGRGCGKDGAYIELKISHLGLDLIKQRLPGIFELALTFANIDPSKQNIPIVPTCHYMMGGIPTNKNTNVLTIDPTENNKITIINNLYAIGECASISIHGANRLGGNSLLELIVFGKAAGKNLINNINSGLDFNKTAPDLIETAANRLYKLQQKKHGESCWHIKDKLKKVMQNHFGVFRDGKNMQTGISQLQSINKQAEDITITDRNKTFNTELLEALEIDNLLKTAMATAIAANAREESRGAHVREDFPKRDDQNWLKHTLVFANNTINYRAVNLQPETVPSFIPTERAY
ncbi:MAG: succinate dehydrogenase flavoprotein subunit [Gammaproteobacteria bacterium]